MRNKEPKPQKEPKQEKVKVEKATPRENRDVFAFIRDDERELVHLHNQIEQHVDGKTIQTQADIRITDKRIYMADRSGAMTQESVIGLDKVEYVSLESSLRKKRHVFWIILSILIMIGGGVLVWLLKNYFLAAISGGGLIVLIIALATGRKIYTNALVLGLTFGLLRVSVGNVVPDEARAIVRNILTAMDTNASEKVR